MWYKKELQNAKRSLVWKDEETHAYEMDHGIEIILEEIERIGVTWNQLARGMFQ
jgi:hypothetical protein